MARTLINGRDTDMFSVHDRGLQYGDGLFETLAVRDGRPLAWQPHLQRLAKGCAALGMPMAPESLLAAESEALCRGQSLGVLKIVVTRGSGGRGYAPPTETNPTRMVALHAWPDHPPAYRDEGINVSVCSTRLSQQPRLAGLKHLNRLEQVLARAELGGRDAAEGLMLDTADRLIEGTMSNVFLVHGSELLTPDLSLCGVAGIVRARILERAADWGLIASVRDLTMADMHAADEMFLTNSIIGVWPARSAGAHKFSTHKRSDEIVKALAAEDFIVPP